MREIAEMLILLQSILVSVAIIIFCSSKALEYAMKKCRLLEWLLDYAKHRKKFEEYLKEVKYE